MIVAQFATDNGKILIESRDDNWICAVNKAYIELMKLKARPITYLVLYVEEDK